MVDFEGRVLRAPRISPANASTTGEPNTGVIRDAKPLPAAYTLTAPDFVDAYADMYRSSVIDAPGTTPVEHSVWAQNTASLGMVSDPAWYQSQGTGTISQGELEVLDMTPGPVPDGTPVPSNWGKLFDGSTRIVVQDDGNRSVSNIFALVIARGDVDDYDDDGWVDETDPAQGRAGSNPYPVFLPAVSDISNSGVVTLSDTNGYVGDPPVQDTLAVLLGGGVSKERGDSIVEVRYSLSAARFLWSRNDRYQTRLKWNGRMQGWFPLRGNPTDKLGVLEDGATFTIAPMPLGVKSGMFLPGDVGSPDAYSMVRLGLTPGASQSTPALIRAYPDNEVEGGFDFSHDDTVDGVVGLGKGTLEFSPNFIALNAGKSVWYVSRDFNEDADGIIGGLSGSDIAPLYLAPIPTSWDYPLLRIGNRRYLQPILKANDAVLNSLIVDEGTVSVSLTTGKLRFAAADIAKADPDEATFDKLYLGAQVVYDGISMGPPQGTKDPVALTEANGKLYIPNHIPLPGFVSGILDAPDGTGAVPDQAGTPASTRPGGDTAVSTTTGRLRQASDGVGDAFLFSRHGAIREIQIVGRESDLPSSSKIPQGTAFIALEYSDSVGSVVRLSRNDTKNFGLDTVYFLQSTFMPSHYTNKARLIGQTRFVFRFDGDEVLYFRIDSGIDSGTYSWAASSLAIQDSYTPEEVAVSIQAAIHAGAGFGLASVKNGSVVLSADDPDDGEVEIGWGGTDKDLTGAAALGFLPGWLVVSGQDNWLPSSGMSLGLYRSPVNLDRSSDTPDVRAEDRAVDLLLTDDIQQTPFVFFDRPPLEDIAGYDEGVFFSLQTVVEDPEGPTFIDQPLEHFEDIVHRFESRRFDWVTSGLVSTKLRRAASSLPLNNLSVVPESMLGASGIGGGLFVSSDGGPFVSQEQDTDYLLPSDGAVGTAQLITRYGDLRTFGGNGSYLVGSSTFTDTLATFDTDGVVEGDQLQVTGGDAAGTYIVQTVGSTSLALEPSFLSTSSRPVTWEVYRGFTDDVFDPMVVADQVYKDFNHLTEEPFRVKVLSLLGVMPGSPVVEAPAVEEGEEEGGGGGRDFGGGDEVIDNGPGRDVNPGDPVILWDGAFWTGALDEAVEHGRLMAIRYGLETPTATNQATLAGLTQEKLGDMGNGNLVVPDTISSRATSGAYSIRLSNDRFAPTLVGGFSEDPDDIEVLDADWTDDDGVDHPIGEVKFNSILLVSYDLAEVWYVQEFLGSDLLGALEAEYDPLTNEFNFSDADITAQAGKKVYFCEQMITDSRLDVSVAPLSGTVGFEDPIKEGQVVEMSYKTATVEGRSASDEIVEFLPIYIRDEVATRINSTTYRFNVGAPKTIAEHIEPVVYIGPLMQNFSTEDYVIDFAPELGGEGRIVFITKTIPDWAPVKVTYAVYEAKGGERAYDTSQKPVYRPPFFIKSGQDHFGVRGDRTSEFSPGQLMRVGAHTFYVLSTQFFEAYTTTNPDGSTTEGGNVTRVDIFPPTFNEVGSRSPGNDLVSVITNEPVTAVVDPDGALPVVTTTGAGFMTIIDISPDAFEFEPVAPGTRTIHFRGNLSAFAIPGHILEMGGYPFTIASTSMNEDGTRTRISLTTPSPIGFLASTNPTVKISYRPVYPPGVRDLLGPAGVLDTQNSTLILFGEKDEVGASLPGRTLLRGVEYQLDPDSGSVSLLGPVQAALVSGQRLSLRHTKLDTLNLFQSDGVVQYPRYTATYLHGIVPSLGNGLLHGRLTGTFSFRSPDVFYWRVPTLRSFLGEAAQEAVGSIQSKQPAGGSTMALGAATSKNWEQGRLGILGERGHLTDLDRAARAFLSFYNRAIVAFEQAKESIDGAYVGDRDGKFRFFIGKGKDWPTPGYEDDVTGLLSSKNLWALAYTQAAPDSGILITQEDPIVNPGTATLTGGVLTGDFPDSDRLAELVLSQIQLITNDVDDILVTGSETPLQIPKTLFPYFDLEAMGFYERMGDSHPFSRLFPTQARVFFTTYPGIGATDTSTGRYTFGSLFGGSKKATYRKEVGQVGNLALGPVENITSASLFKRRARARVWKYLPGGVPANAFGASAEIKEPVIIVTPGFISDLPIDPDTGYPDYLTFLSEGGVGVDAVAGDPELSVPGFVQGDQIGWGKPDGSTYLGLYLDAVTIFGRPSYTGLFIRDVQYGCVIRLQDADGAPITESNRVLVGTASDQGTPAALFPIVQGDTLLADPPLSVKSVVAATPSTEDIQALAEAMDTYRIGYDVAVRTSGKVIDLTLPSFEDPFFFGLKEILGQNPLDPMTPVGGVVDFTYLEQNPLQIPALFGQARDDSGDFQIPYLKAKATELDRFTEASIDIGFLLAANTGTYIYPDEIIGIDGELVGVANVGDVYSGATLKEAATLMSNADALEATNNPSTVGVGDLREFDLVLVEAGSGPSVGTDGILSIGRVTNPALGSGKGAFIEPPRFVTQTNPPGAGTNQTGSPIRYVLDNAMVYVNDPSYSGSTPQATPPSGVVLTQDTALGKSALEFSQIDLIRDIKLHDGQTQGVDGLNDLWSHNPADAKYHNKITIELFARTDSAIADTPAGVGTPGSMPVRGDLLYTITIEKGVATFLDVIGGVGNQNTLALAAATDLSFGDDYSGGAGVTQIVFNGVNLWHLTPLGTDAAWFLPFVTVTTTKTTLYGYECSISVDTFNWDTTDKGESTTGWIDTDRLTFHDVIDLRWARPRGFVHPELGTNSLETRLLVHEVTAGGLGNIGCTVNRDVNGVSTPFTFLRRSAETDVAFAGGLWADAGVAKSPSEDGSLRVPAFEGQGDIPITGTGIRFAGVPSSEYGPSGLICQGSATTEAAGPAYLYSALFDGGTEKANNSSAASSSLDQYPVGTVAMWIKTTDTNGWWFRWSDPTFVADRIIFFIGSGGKAQVFIEMNNNGSSVDRTGSTVINDGAWHMVGITWNWAVGVQLWVDGVPDAAFDACSDDWVSPNMSILDIGAVGYQGQVAHIGVFTTIKDAAWWGDQWDNPQQEWSDSLHDWLFGDSISDRPNLVAIEDRVSGLNLTTTDMDNTNLILDHPGGVSFKGYDNRLAAVSVTGGNEDNIEPGDIVVIEGSSDPANRATTKAGTYLVRHLVPGGPTDPRVTMQTSAGAGAGWAPFQFPRGVGFDDGANELTITDLVPNISTSVNQTATSNPSCFIDPAVSAGTYRIYVVRDIVGMASADETTYRNSILSAQYTVLNDTGPQPVFTLAAYQDARGTVITAAAFKALFDAGAPEGGHYISGMQFFPVTVGGDAFSAFTSQIVKLPLNNLVGTDSATTILGARWFTLNPLVVHTGTTGLLYSGNSGDPGISGDLRTSFNSGDVTVVETTKEDSNDFVTPQDAVVYRGVLGALYVGNIANVEWNALNNPGTSFGGGTGSTVDCILPGQTLHLSNALSGNASEGADGFYAQAGVFLEPSFPQPTFDLAAANEHVVDATRSLTSDEIGMRDAGEYVGSGEVMHTSPETVSFEVRRIRRWHDIQTSITESIEPLRYAYETRRGRITGYTQTPKQFGVVAAQSFVMTFDTDKSIAPLKTDDVWNDGSTYSGTQLGDFHDEDVNIKAGDLFRLIGDDGAVLEEVPIVAVFDDNRIKLAPPGITTVDTLTLDDDGGMRFEVFLRRAPVPHEQSNQELLDLVTDRVVHETMSNWTLETGGHVVSSGVYDDDVNRMRDDLNVSGITTWSELGVHKGDIVIIDPAGNLPGTTESGGRPVGDTGLLGRTGYAVGLPTPTDDNRGFYRIVGFDETVPADPVLLVTGINSLAGSKDSAGTVRDVIFPEDITYQSTLGYALLPTIHNSAVTGDALEGQMDLRATTKKVGASYQTDFWSIRPFSYTIIRPSNLFSEEAVDLVLMMRERILSWIEEIKTAAQGDRKSGSYFVFQRDEHIEDVGTPGDPLDGLGVLSNLVLASLLGEVATSPFLNTSDCLSFLDRRFWVQDSKLDSLQPKDSVTMQVFSGGPAFPAAGGPYTAYTDEASGGGSVLPGLPDRIDLVLDNEDRFRPIRYTWLAYRVHTILGTLAGIRRFDAEFPGRLEEQERMLLLQETTEKSTT